jgi:hypothetical protein
VALAGARELAVPALRGEALHYCHQALSEPDDLAVRIEIGDELARLAERHGDDNLLLCASLAQLTSSVETGDMGSVDAALATMDAVVSRVREPFFKWYAACARSMRSMVDGKLERAETEAREAFALGTPLNHESAYHTYVTQIWSILWLTGRVRESEALVREISCKYPGIPGWRAVLAGIDLDLGRKEPARRTLSRLVPQAEETVSDSPFLLSLLAPLSDLCARVGDAGQARTLYRKLLPYARHHGFVHLGIGTHGPLTRHLGLLAARMGELDRALEHLSDAVLRAERMASPTFTALCSFAHARVLLVSDVQRAREHAAVLLWNAAAIAVRCGMTELHARCRAVVERFSLQLHGEPNAHRRMTARTRSTC